MGELQILLNLKSYWTKNPRRIKEEGKKVKLDPKPEPFPKGEFCVPKKEES